MPNNENNYRIRLDFAKFLKGLPEFRISDCESADFVNVTINYHNSLAFPRSRCRLTRYSQHYIMDQLFKELEKDFVDREELMGIGRIFKNYLSLLKQIDVDSTYYIVTPGLMAALFIVLQLSLLFFPDNSMLMYSSLIADLYGLGFWLFSVWSFNQHQRVLDSLDNKLIEKINFLKSLSFPMQINPYYVEPSASLSAPPPYEEVLSEDVMRGAPQLFDTAPSNRSNFFYASGSNESVSDRGNTDPRPERCYSI